MYTLTLTSEQLKVLDIVLECAVDEIHYEILHTDNRCYRENLKERRHILQELLSGVHRLAGESIGSPQTAAGL